MSRYILIVTVLGGLLTGCPEHREPNLQLAPQGELAVRGRAVHRPAPLRPQRPVRSRLVRAVK